MALRAGRSGRQRRGRASAGVVWDVALGANGRPVMVYATFPSNQYHEYWYAAWTGARWVSQFLTSGGGTISPGGIEFVSIPAGSCSITQTPRSSTSHVRSAAGSRSTRWATDDGGWHWRHTTVVPAGGTDNVRPVVPRGWDDGPMSLLWLRGNDGSYSL